MFRKLFLIFTGLISFLGSDLQAQQIEFPNSNTLKANQSVQNDIFGNEASMKLLSTYLQAAKAQGIYDQALQEIGLPHYISSNESWLISRGVSISWPEATDPVEKANFLSEFVANIRPYDRSTGNSKLGMEIQYYRTQEMADLLNEVYGEDSFTASGLEVQASTVMHTEMGLDLSASNLRKVGLSQKDLSDATVIGVTQQLDAKTAASYGASRTLQLIAERSPLKNMPHLVIEVQGDPYFLTLANKEEADQLRKVIEEEKLQKGSFVRKNSKTYFVAQERTAFKVDPEKHGFAVVKSGKGIRSDEFFAGVTPSADQASLLENRTHLYIGSPEAAIQAYAMIDKDYARYLAAQEKAKQEAAARALAKQQREEAAALRRQAAEEERTGQLAAKKLLEGLKAEHCEDDSK